MGMTLRRLFSIVGVVILTTACAHAKAGLAPARVVATPGVAAATPVRAGTDTSQASPDAELVSDFRRRVDRYMRLHDKAQKQGSRPQQQDDIGENLVSQQAMAMRIRLARSDARPGDLFSRPIARALRRAMDPELRGLVTLGARESIREDAPATFVLAVNAAYPEGASRSTMPGKVLRVLPVLPDGLEYRIVDTHLLLIDVEANIVVDYMLDVMCRNC